MNVEIDFCGERMVLSEGDAARIGREGDLVIDDNPYLHRRFLEVRRSGGIVLISNVGSRLSATVADSKLRMQAWLAPGAQLPIVFDQTNVRFTAGSTTYEIEIFIEDGPFIEAGAELGATDASTETLGQVTFTRGQLLAILALAEPLLRQQGRGTASVPTTAEAAQRLGWTTRTFNKYLDKVCFKLAKSGVRGLHGGPGQLATNRRGRLVEYAMTSGIVGVVDLRLLDEANGIVDDETGDAA